METHRRIRHTIAALLAICASSMWAQNSSETLRETQLRLWLDLKKFLSANDGTEYFMRNVLDSVIPGGAYGVHSMEGTVVSSEAVGTALNLLLAISDKKTPEVRLKLDQRPPASVRIRRGAAVEFEGVGVAFTPAPFMLMLSVSSCRQAANDTALKCELETRRQR